MWYNENVMEGREVTLELLETNEQELAYLAGLFDGEGCISTTRRVRRGREKAGVEVMVNMTTPEPLYVYKKVFGGSILVSPPAKEGYKAQYRWRIRGRKVETFLKALEPYLIVKKAKVLLALSLLSYWGLESPRKVFIGDELSKRRIKKGE